jgi:hydroxymethylglutaryl-CoA lyase
MSFPTHVKIVEVGPRDGLQSESQILSVPDRIQLINFLSESGLKAIEVGSFVSPRWVPSLVDSGQVYEDISKKPGVDYSVLVPNQKGYDLALHHKVNSIAVFTAASETFCQKNINTSIEGSLQTFKDFVPEAKKQGLRVRGYVSCAIACPYEGPTPPKRLHSVALALSEMGCDEISLGDTIGVGTPKQVKNLFHNFPVPLDQVAVHFHDTYGQALANVYAALEEGISIIDSSVSGLGGCPYAPGASGNVATEDVVYLLNGLGIDHGINLDSLLKAAEFIDEKLGRNTTSKSSQALRLSKKQ